MSTSSLHRMSPTRHLIALVVLVHACAASVQAQALHDDVVKVLDFTRSPDGRLGITVPTREQHTADLPNANRLNKLVETATGRVLAVIDADTGYEHMNHGDAYVKWAKDGSGVFWHVSGKWGPRTMNYLRVSKDRVMWQANLTTAARQEILRRVRQAAPQTYAAAVRRNRGEGDPSKGFILDVELDKKADYQLPLRFYIGLTSEPRGFGPMMVPIEAAVIARLVGVLGKDGSIQWSEFKMMTRKQALRRELFLEGGEDENHEIVTAIRRSIQKAAPSALEIISKYDASGLLDTPLIKIEHAWTDNMPFSLGGRFLRLVATDSKSYTDYPTGGEVLVKLPGIFHEGGTVEWSEAKVVTGQQALKQMMSVQNLKFFESAKMEVLQHMTTQAPETMAAFHSAAAGFKAALPKEVRQMYLNDDVLLITIDGPDSERTNYVFHPAELPYPFTITVMPAPNGFGAQDWPQKARFNATLEGTLIEDGSFTWGKFSLLIGADAR